MIRGANDMLPEKQILNQSHLIEGATFGIPWKEALAFS